MRLGLVLAVLLLPATAFAQMFEGPNGPIPVHKCVQTTAGAQCSPVRDGANFTASNGYTRVYWWGEMVSPQQAMVALRGPEPYLTR
jgi:hypothetical protein